MTSIWEDFVAQERAEGMSEEGIQNESEKRDSNPALYDAALALWELDRPDVLEALIAAGAIDVNGPTPRSEQHLLFFAIGKKRTRAARMLIDAGADVRRQEGERGYLFWAAFNNTDPAILEMLLDAPGGPAEPVTEEILAVARRKASPQIVAMLEARAGGQASS